MMAIQPPKSKPPTGVPRGSFRTQILRDTTASCPGDYLATLWWYPGGGAGCEWLARGWGSTEDEAKRALEEAKERGKRWIGRKVGGSAA